VKGEGEGGFTSTTSLLGGGKSTSGRTEGLPPEWLSTRGELRHTVRWMVSFCAPNGGVLGGPWDIVHALDIHIKIWGGSSCLNKLKW